MAERYFGEVDGFPPGSWFASRLEVSRAGIHRPNMHGISGGPLDGADSIVLNGGYEDDQDSGDVVIYTGHGGNDPSNGRQIADQHLEKGNAALAKSCVEGYPVRVVRGFREPSGRGPQAGYRYDGLYRVERYWSETGKSGYTIWRFRLVAEDVLVPEEPVTPETAAQPVARALGTIQRLVRNTTIAQHVKQLHDHKCQVCGIRLTTPGGPYAEGAHIRPLGRPHDGPDVESNILCLCANHHVLFDTGSIIISEEMMVLDNVAKRPLMPLCTTPQHKIDVKQLTYHRLLFAKS